jgi:flagellum-specific peptidoglycan hydrolase FlgJ
MSAFRPFHHSSILFWPILWLIAWLVFSPSAHSQVSISGPCVYAGWESSTSERGVCQAPWVAQNLSQNVIQRQYSCGSGGTRCNPAIFGTGPRNAPICVGGRGVSSHDLNYDCIRSARNRAAIIRRCSESQASSPIGGSLCREVASYCRRHSSDYDCLTMGKPRDLLANSPAGPSDMMCFRGRAISKDSFGSFVGSLGGVVAALGVGGGVALLASQTNRPSQGRDSGRTPASEESTTSTTNNSPRGEAQLPTSRTSGGENARALDPNYVPIESAPGPIPTDAECLSFDKEYYSKENSGQDIAAQIQRAERENGIEGKKNRFYEIFAPLALKIQKRTGWPASVTLSQIIIETGWGGSNVLQRTNNFGGHSCFSENAESTMTIRNPLLQQGAKEVELAGMNEEYQVSVPCTYRRPAAEGAFYRTFSNVLEASFFYADNVLENERYKSASDHVKEQFRNGQRSNPDTVVRGLGPYAADPNYRTQLSNSIRTNNLTRFDTMTVCE